MKTIHCLTSPGPQISCLPLFFSAAGQLNSKLMKNYQMQPFDCEMQKSNAGMFMILQPLKNDFVIQGVALICRSQFVQHCMLGVELKYSELPPFLLAILVM